MFEKEAEEWVENNLHSTEEDYIKAFKDGAEFGYNKAKEEMQAQIEKMKADYDKLLDEKIELEDRLAESRECY